MIVPNSTNKDPYNKRVGNPIEGGGTKNKPDSKNLVPKTGNKALVLTTVNVNNINEVAPLTTDHSNVNGGSIGAKIINGPV